MVPMNVTAMQDGKAMELNALILMSVTLMEHQSVIPMLIVLMPMVVIFVTVKMDISEMGLPAQVGLGHTVGPSKSFLLAWVECNPSSVLQLQ